MKTTRTHMDGMLTVVELHDTESGYDSHAGFIHRDKYHSPIAVTADAGFAILYSAQPSKRQVTVADSGNFAYVNTADVSLKMSIAQAEDLRDKLNALIKTAKKDPALY